MCLYCPFRSLKFFCIIIIFVIIACCTYLYCIQYNSDDIFISLTKSLVEDDFNLNYTADHKDTIKIGIIPSSHNSDDAKDLACYSPFIIVIAFFLFVFCNTCPEYCFRKRIKVNKCRYIHVEKKCGCNYVYETTTDPK